MRQAVARRPPSPVTVRARHVAALVAVAVLTLGASLIGGRYLSEAPTDLPAQAEAVVAPAAEAHVTPPEPPAPPQPMRPAVVLPAGTPAPSPTPAPPLERWVQSHRETGLYSGSDPASLRFTDLPVGSYLRVLEIRPDWLLVSYAGDGAARQAGTAWVQSADVTPTEPPPLWLKNHRETTLWTESVGSTARIGPIQPWSLFEVVGKPEHGRFPVRFPGNGASPPGRGWIDDRDVGWAAPPARSLLPQGYPLTADGAALRINVPYRTQIDGSASQSANCGPASAGMLLDANGIDVPTLTLRSEMLDLMGMRGNDTGVYIETIAQILGRYGVRTADLWTGSPVPGSGYRRWSLDDARAHLRAGHPVVVQVRYRLLPNREDYEDADDHYVILTGLVGDSFLYNDPINREGPGYDRVITADQLRRAWFNSSEPRAAFAVLGKT